MTDAPLDMTVIRAAIDDLDRRIVPLLAERTEWVRRAAAFKPTRVDVVVPWRIEDVVAKAAAHAAATGADPAPLAAMYRAIVDISIGQEALAWDALHAGAADGDAVEA
ncbi:chorismate mutase [Oleispirillum naphthae]|uniref:chorismate mutase n=1 Tax=Oleispirillum naphthae TaxID=2838853 RepID=UPI00308259B8